MRINNILPALILTILIAGTLPVSGLSQQLTGSITTEARVFLNSPLSPVQKRDNISIAFKPEYFQEWSNGYQRIVFAPYFRFDQGDKERTHFDIREMYWEFIAQTWELRVGINTVFWGVTEAQHLVDIINQTDLVENLDGEDKLGQPMINFTLIRNWGTLDLFILPGFRKRSFPGERGRLRFPIQIATNETEYVSGSKDKRIDFAVHWSGSFDNFDLNLSHFYGTNREPFLLESFDQDGSPYMIPQYDIINQTGLEFQYFKNNWLWKLEAITRNGRLDNHFAFDGGFEYTINNIMNKGADVGLIAEYLYDNRGGNGPAVFEDDIFIGARLALNDVQSTDLLAGFIIDRDSGSRLFQIEASRRIRENWKINIETRGFTGINPSDRLYGLRKDGYLQIELSRYF